jgi:hypothetical protein
MKKLELLQLLKDNDVKSTDLRSFMNKNKANKELISCFEKTRNWLIEVEEVEYEKEIEATIKKRAERFNLSVKKYKELQRLCEILMGSINSGYSMGDLKKIYVNDELFFTLDDKQEYAKSCKYSATHGLIRLDLSKKQLLNLKKTGYNSVKCEDQEIKISGYKGSFEIEF